MEPVASERDVVGVQPWLPWPLSRWRSWTEPVRAERLAALRIGLALVIVLDIATSYLPAVHDFYGPDSLSRAEDKDLFGYMARPPRYSWSLLRGVGHPLNFSLALTLAVLSGACVLLGLLGRLRDSSERADLRGLFLALAAWVASSNLALLGFWARLRELPDVEGALSLNSAAVLWALASVMLGLAVVGRARGPRDEPGYRLLLLLVACVWLMATAFLFLGYQRYLKDAIAQDDALSLSWLLAKWDDDPHVLLGAMILYLASAILLMLGLFTRLAAILTWVLAISFANLNAYIDNNGDVTRGILLFYLMLCPCGAAWSLDRWRARRRGDRVPGVAFSPQARSAFVYPWIVRLLFLQMIVLYFFNGLYKLCGLAWREGNSLYYVLADAAMTRVSYAAFHPPLFVMRFMTYCVLAWEISFPLLVIYRPIRIVALWIGVAFHAGIWVSLELGSFSPYLLCMYLPLVPWERWVGMSPVQ